jgi:2-polyprenyl-3-methyl-5-hydroxy-6-metoxy-1,4-benzoquinol methylase
MQNVAQPSMREEIDYYNQRWRQFEFANLYSQERCVFILQALLELGLEKPRICDLGCGAGWLTNILSSFGPSVGVELSPDAVEVAKQRYPGAQFVCADATTWEPEAGSFDVVVSQEVIEHISDKPKYLSVVHKALRPGGYLLMTTPNLDVLNAIPDSERKTIWEIQPVELPVTRRQLTALMQAAGFGIVKTSSAVTGCGRLGIHRMVNSHKLNKLMEQVGLRGAWNRWLLNRDFGMYLTTVAQRL